MKGMKGKHKQPKEVVFDRLVGKGGWTLDYNKDVKRYNLCHQNDLQYSHVDSKACVKIAKKRFDVDMGAEKEEEKDA